MSMLDFNNAENQSDFGLIPKGEIVRVRMTIQPGGYNDVSLGLTEGLAKKNEKTGSVYFNCKFVILNGKYAKRIVWGMIGIKSEKGPEWGNQGRAFIKAILNSARGFSSKDESEEAKKARILNSYSELDGITFLAKIEVEEDQYGQAKNTIRTAITIDSKDYVELNKSYPVGADGVPIANVESDDFNDDIPF